MRPDVLNPLFAEVEVLKGVGPALARPLKRLGLERVVDVLFHLPVSWIERKRVEVLDQSDAGSIVTVEVTSVDYRQGGGRGPFREPKSAGIGRISSGWWTRCSRSSKVSRSSTAGAGASR